MGRAAPRGLRLLSLVLGCLLSPASPAATKTETHPYLGASFTLTPSASATTGASDYYTVISAGLSWKPSDRSIHQFGYDFGIDSLDGATTTYSTLSFATVYRATSFLRPRLAAQGTFSNSFDFFGMKAKGALRLVFSPDFRVDPGLVVYFDSAGSRAVGAYFDLNWYFTETWSAQATGQLMANLDSSSTSTQYSIGGGLSWDVTEVFTLYGSINYSAGIATSPVLGGGGNKGAGHTRPKPNKTTLANYSGATQSTTAVTLALLLTF